MRRRGRRSTPSRSSRGQPGDNINFANWPLYIDYTKDKDGNRYIPSLRDFTKQTGIEVNFQDAIQSNPEFFGKLHPQLQAGQDTGWDIIVITNGRYFTALVENEWVYPLDPTKHPNFDQHAADVGQGPRVRPRQQALDGLAVGVHRDRREQRPDQGPRHEDGRPGQPGQGGDEPRRHVEGGHAGLGHDQPGHRSDDVGAGRVEGGGRLVAEAAGRRRDPHVHRPELHRRPHRRQPVGHHGLVRDVMYYKTWAGYDNLDWNFPDDGALHWVDNMLVPAEAANPAGAIELMDFYYQPEVATPVTEWVLYLSPVPATKQLILRDAKKAEEQNYKGYANKLFATAENPYMYPDDALLARTSYGRELKTDDEREEWDAIFLPISQG